MKRASYCEAVRWVATATEDAPRFWHRKASVLLVAHIFDVAVERVVGDVMRQRMRNQLERLERGGAR